MIKHKLLSFEPTPEMVNAAEEAYMPFGDMDLALRMAILAAPAVQGEPVAEVQVHPADHKSLWLTKTAAPEVFYVGMKLYAAPQPAKQQPSTDESLTPVPDELFAAEFAAWWEEHGQFCRAGGGTYERTFAFEAWRHLYPQLMNLQMAAFGEQP